MVFALFQQIFFFFFLALAVSAIVSAYREDDSQAILRGTWRRLGKFTAFALIIVFGLLGFELLLFGWSF